MAQTTNSVSSESAVLHKIGFNLSNDSGKVFAKCINSLRTPNGIVPAILEAVVCIQFITLGFIPTHGNLFDGSSYTKIISTILVFFSDFSSPFSSEFTGNLTIFIIFACLIAIWTIGYLFFITKYKQTQTFSQYLLKFLLYFGYYFFDFFLIVISTNIAYFLRPLFYTDIHDFNPFISFLAILLYLAFIKLVSFMTQSLQSSPDINVKSRTSLWPQNVFPLLFRSYSLLALPAIFELLRESSVPMVVLYLLNIIDGVGGILIVYLSDANVFPSGVALMSTEYFLQVAGSLVSIVYEYVHGDSFYYLLVYIVLIIIFSMVSNMISNKLMRRRVDKLYLPFDQLIELIETPNQCISLIKTGVIFNVQCMTNRSLFNWAITRWPNDQPLLLLITYIEYIWRYSYPEIVHLVSVAIDVGPLSSYDNLLFYQIFSRLPTKQTQILRRLEGVRRLYDLPKTSLKHFWLSISNRQWDEAVMRSTSFKDDIVQISRIFSNLIFDNPASDAILHEFIRFCVDIQGNHQMAAAANRELRYRQMMNNAYQANNENNMKQDNPEASKSKNESSLNISKLSSVHSSIFMSQLDDLGDENDRAQYSIQSSVNARPIYTSGYFIILILILSVVSMASVIVVYAISNNFIYSINHKVTMGGRLHMLSHTITKILFLVLEFATRNENPTMSGQVFNVNATRNELNDLCNQLDAILSEILSLHSYLDHSVLNAWSSHTSQTILVSPIDAWDANVSVISAIRLFHVRSRTVGFTPDDGLGNISSPSSDLIEVTNLYSCAVESISFLLELVKADMISKINKDKELVLATTIACLCVTLLAMIISCPIIIVAVIREFEFILSLYGSISRKVIIQRIVNQDSQKVSKDFADNDETEHEKDNFQQQKKSLPLKLYKAPQIIFIFVLVAVVTAIPIAIILAFFFKYNDKVVYVVNGLSLSIPIVEYLGNICLHAFRSFTTFPSPLSVKHERTTAFKQASQMLTNYLQLYFGTETFPNGLILEDKILPNPCNVVNPNVGINGSCSVIHENIYTIYNLIDMLHKYDETDPNEFGCLASIWWRTFYPAARTAIFDGLNEFYNFFVTMHHSEKDHNDEITLIGFLIGWILFIIDIVVSYVFMKYVLKPAILSLLKPMVVMPPESIAESTFLLRFLQGDFDSPSRKTTLENKHPTGNSSTPLIDFILEGVLVIGPDNTIIASNRKYHEMMDNTAEEILGVNISQVMPANVLALFDGVKSNRKAGANQNHSIETTLYTEEMKELNVRITLISTTDPNIKKTCALIITDRSDLIQAQAQLRKEKQNVEELLDSILPHNIAVSLLNGKDEISFQVDQACVLFSDIVSFTPMCSNMTAKQVMNTLNNLFTAFDTALAEYQRVTKLKTIGDAYVCAAGIFEHDGPLEEACKEIVLFAMQMQDLIPKVNEKLNTSIRMRIGIHTDGPLICGVLGKEKPLFEAIGNVVTLAEDLEASGRPDNIHVAKVTVDLIKSLNLEIEERGDDVTVHGIDPPTYTILCRRGQK